MCSAGREMKCDLKSVVRMVFSTMKKIKRIRLNDTDVTQSIDNGIDEALTRRRVDEKQD